MLAFGGFLLVLGAVLKAVLGLFIDPKAKKELDLKFFVALLANFLLASGTVLLIKVNLEAFSS